MARIRTLPVPLTGSIATYVGRSAKSARNVKLIAEAVAGRVVVEAIGRRGDLVRFTVKRENLKPLQPGLFDQI